MEPTIKKFKDNDFPNQTTSSNAFQVLLNGSRELAKVEKLTKETTVAKEDKKRKRKAFDEQKSEKI